MPLKRYHKDPRTQAQRTADEKVRRGVEKGEILQLDAQVEQEAIEHVLGRREQRRDLVALLGRELGILRRAHGLSQDQVAQAIGTNKSNISRLETGRSQGLTIERFLAVLEAFDALGSLNNDPVFSEVLGSRQAEPAAVRKKTAPKSTKQAAATKRRRSS